MYFMCICFCIHEYLDKWIWIQEYSGNKASVTRPVVDFTQKAYLFFSLFLFFLSKIYRYSSTDVGKQWDRPLNRKGHIRFNPEKVLESIQATHTQTTDLEQDEKTELVEKYLEVSHVSSSHIFFLFFSPPFLVFWIW